MRKSFCISILFITCGTLLISCIQDKKNLSPVSTIDSTYQKTAELSLSEQMKLTNAEWGCVAMMSVETGELKILVNLKQDTISDKFTNDYNFAAMQCINPGQLFSTVSLLACMDDNLVTPDDTLLVTGNAIFSNVKVMDANENGLGFVTVRKAFEAHSNVGIAKLIQKNYGYKPEEFLKKISQFDVDKPLGISFAKETAPYFNKPEAKSWSQVTIPWMSIGYECRMTPLQILTFYNSIANQGKRIRPVTEKCDSTMLPVVLKEKICSPSALKLIHDLLIVQGSNPLKSISGKIPMAGRMANVSVPGKNGMYDENAKIRLSVVYFPADKPLYTCLVAMKCYGSSYVNLCPVVIKKIMEQSLSQK